MTLTVSVLSDGYFLRAWEARALQRLSDCYNIDISYVIINTETDSFTDLISKVLNQGVWGVYRAIQKGLESTLGRPDPIRPVKISKIPCLSDGDVITCQPEPATPFGNELPDKAIKTLRETDICIRFGFGIIMGEALTAPTFGVLSYHHGDLEEYRGRPAGFWEMYNNENTVGITIQRLTESLDGGEIVAKKTVSIDSSCRWRSTLAKLYDASDSLLPVAFESILKDDIRNPEKIGNLYTTPDWRTTLRFIARQHIECARRYSFYL